MEPSQIQALMDKMDAKAAYLVQVTRDANAATKDLRAAERDIRKLLDVDFAKQLHDECVEAIQRMREQVAASVETVDRKLFEHFRYVADGMLDHLRAMPARTLARIYAERQLEREVMGQDVQTKPFPLAGKSNMEMVSTSFTIGFNRS